MRANRAGGVNILRSIVGLVPDVWRSPRFLLHVSTYFSVSYYYVYFNLDADQLFRACRALAEPSELCMV